MKGDQIRRALEDLAKRNRERAAKRIMYRARHIERKKMGTVREYLPASARKA